MRYNKFIAIDPDSDKSGVAMWKDNAITVLSLDIPELLEFIQDNRDAKVIVEAGWLNKTHFHLNPRDSKAVAAAKGNSVGRNAEVGRVIVKMCRHWNVNVTEQRPLKKTWRGADGKITHDELSYFVPDLPSRTNQEKRDAVLLLWVFMGKPVRVKIKNAKL